MSFLLAAHSGISLVLVTTVYGFFGREAALGALTGSAVSFGNSLLLSLYWPRILAKKQVALSVGVIVFKFAILAWIVYEVATAKLVDLRWFAVGLGTVVPTALLTAFWVSRRDEKNESISSNN